jgi:hypothetical protein
MGASFMSVLLVCPCGKRWTSDDGANAAAAICPVCGRPLTPIAPGGWRSLWPRLTLAVLATLLVVVAVGMALVHLLPATSREAPSVTEANSIPQPEKELDKPLPQEAPQKPLLPPREASAPADKPILPLLDNPPALVPPLKGPSKPKGVKPLEEPAPKGVPELPVKDDFFQHLIISRVSRYRILDLDMGQNVQYVFVSRFRVQKKNDDGGMVVEQKVESVRLSNADPSLQDRLNELLQKTKGATFTLTLNARREVTKFEGDQEAIKVFTGDNPLGGPSFLLWSFLDRDGWKELAQLSFFQPPSSVRRGERWDRALTHSWGPLGTWAGKIYFQSTGKQAGLDRFDYALELTYKPPKSGSGLPFEIGKSQFQIETARGVIAYQPSRKRMAAAEERFHVRGLLTVSFLGAESTVQMDEMQLFQLRILDKNPLGPVAP